MVRYEVTFDKAGHSLETEHVRKVTATHSRLRPTVVVSVPRADRAAFERDAEACPHVVAYSADPRRAGEPQVDWKRGAV